MGTTIILAERYNITIIDIYDFADNPICSKGDMVYRGFRKKGIFFCTKQRLRDSEVWLPRDFEQVINIKLFHSIKDSYLESNKTYN